MNMQKLKFRELANFINGRAFKPSEWGAEGLPIIRIQNLTDPLKPFNYFKGKYDQKYFVENGDFLISWSASLGAYVWDRGDALLNQHIFKVNINERIIRKRFFYYATRSILSKMDRYTHGSTMKHITKDLFENLQIPVPALSVQDNIASILEKAESARAKRREANRLTDEFLKSIFMEMFGDTIKNSKGWDVIKFDSIIDNIDSGWSPVCADTRTSNEQWAVLRLGAVTKGIFLPDENKLLPQDVSPRTDLEVKKGDILFSRKNTSELVAACALVHKTPPKLMLPDTIFRFSLKDSNKIIKEYLWGLFSESCFKKKVQSLATGTSGSMPNISKTKLLNMLLPLPPINLQQKFADLVQKIEKLKEKQHESEKELDNLFNSLMQRAFRGDIT